MPDPQVAPARPKKKRTLAVVVALLLAGVGLFFWIRPALSTNNAGSQEAVGPTVALETFVVNLNGGGERAYLRVGIALGLSHSPSRNKEELPVALVRDTILSVLSAARPEQLSRADGKQKLKAAILQALKDRAPQLGVVDVYFTEFLVQM